MKDVVVRVAEFRQRFGSIAKGLDFSPDANRIAFEDGLAKIDIWDWRGNHVERTLEDPRGFSLIGVPDPIRYSPDGRWLAVCSSHKAVGAVVIRVWDTANWSIAEDIADSGPGGCDAMDFTPDGGALVRVVNRVVRPNEMIVYAVPTWTEVWSVQVDDVPAAVAVSPDGTRAAVSGLSLATLMDPSKGPRWTLDIVDLRQRRVIRTIDTYAGGAVAWSPDTRRVVVAGEQHVEIFDPATGQRLLQQKVAGSSEMNVRFTRDGRYLIESDYNGQGTGQGVRIWDGHRQKLIREIAGDVDSISVSRDSRYLAVGQYGGDVTVWEIK